MGLLLLAVLMHVRRKHQDWGEAVFGNGLAGKAGVGNGINGARQSAAVQFLLPAKAGNWEL